MTATPRIYSETAQLKAKEEDIYVASMDNEEQYGPEFYRLGFAEALDTLDEKGEPLLERLQGHDPGDGREADRS